MNESRQQVAAKNVAAGSSSEHRKTGFSPPRPSRGQQLKQIIGVKQTVRQQQQQLRQHQEQQKQSQETDKADTETAAAGNKSQPLRACGCAFKFSPARNRALSYRHKVTSKSEDKLNGTTSREQRERSKSCTPISTEKFSSGTENAKFKDGNKSSTIVKFSSENLLNTEENKEDQKDEKLILVPEVYGEHRFQTTFWWEPRALPYKYSTSVYIDTNTAAKYYVEEVSMKVRLVPCPYVESLGTLHRYKSTVEANVQAPTIIETTFHLTGRFNNETII